jgi:ribosomal protein S18 acetylase RimI-like enzyme
MLGDSMNGKQRIVRTIEEMSMNAWPASETMLYDGWVLRFNDGYTRRANCINPLYASTCEITTKVDFCKHLYSSKGLKPVYKMTRQVYPSSLDAFLNDREYHREAETSVQVMTLVAGHAESDRLVTISECVDDHWIRRFMTMNHVHDKYSHIIASMLQRIALPKCFASIVCGQEIIACGFGVVQTDMIGLFDIVVDQAYRGRGFGTKLVHSVLNWARGHRVRSAYLQVMLDNVPALALYKKIGFSEAYQYWYRVG